MCHSSEFWAVLHRLYGEVSTTTSKSLSSPILVLLVLTTLVCPAGAQQDGIGAGLGFDVEYISPQKFRDPGQRTRAWFPVKYVCGETQPGDRLAAGIYTTDINVLNLSIFKVRVGWWFSGGAGGRAGIQGAQAEILKHGSFYMDCAFIIRQLRNAGWEVGSFIEGFVSIEDLNDANNPPTRVVAVYSALHKQLHDLPDLLPVQTARSYCRLDDQRRLVVTIRNQGEADAPPSTTRIAIDGGSTVERSTPALPAGAQADLEPVPFPRGEGTVSFTLTADSPAVIREMNEANNIAFGACILLE